MQLEPIESGLKLEFDIPNRIARVTHKSNSEKIDEAMLGCGFGSIMGETRPAEEQEKTAYFSSSQSENDQEANTLKLLLAINRLAMQPSICFIYCLLKFSGFRS